ncbi:MAG: mechanosensitive ion channel family protein [Nitrososphaeraceae archaeon]
MNDILIIVYSIIPSTITILGKEISLFSILITAIIFVIGLALAKFFKALSNKQLSNKLPSEVRNPFSRMIYYSILVITLISAISYSGVDLSGLFIAGGIAGIIIGFATQSLFSNVISGIFLYLDKPMKIGDPVLITGSLPDVTGVVIEISLFSCRLQLFDGTHVRLPNTEVFSSKIQNFKNTVARRIEVLVGVSYNGNIDNIKEIIKEIIDNESFILVEPEPAIYIDNFGDSAINLKIWCWTPVPVYLDVMKILLEKIKVSFDKNNIEIPFPQRVVYIHENKDKFNNSKLG